MWQHPALLNEESEEDPHFPLPGMREAMNALPRTQLFTRPHTSPAGASRHSSSMPHSIASDAVSGSGSTARRRSSLDAASRPLSREGPWRDSALDDLPVLRGMRAMMSRHAEPAGRPSHASARTGSSETGERAGTDRSHRTASSAGSAAASAPAGRASGGSLLSSINERGSSFRYACSRNVCSTLATSQHPHLSSPCHRNQIFCQFQTSDGRAFIARARNCSVCTR